MIIKTFREVTIHRFKPDTVEKNKTSFELSNSNEVFLFVVESYKDHYTGGRYHIFEIALALCKLGKQVVWLCNYVPTCLESFVDYECLKNLIVVVQHQGDPTPSIFSNDYVFSNIVGTPLGCIGCVSAYKRKHFNRVKYYQIILVVPPLAHKYRRGPDVEDIGIGWHIIKEGLKSVDVFMTQTELNKKYLSKWLNVSKEKIFIVPPVVNDKVASKFLNSPKQDEIVFISRFVSYKNPMHVLEVARRINYKGKITMIGGGGGLSYNQFYDFAKSFGLNLEIIERCDDYEKFKIISRSSLLIYPTSWEDFGMPPLEAGYYGINTVTYNNPAFEEIYRNLLIYAKRNDVDDLSLITKNFLRRPSISFDLRNFVLSNFTFDHLVDNVRKVLWKPTSVEQPIILFDTVSGCKNRGIGDILLSTVAIKALKKKFPDSIIHYYTHKHSYEILINNQYIDKIITDEKELNKKYTYHLMLKRGLETDCPRNQLNRVDSILKLFNLEIEDKKTVLNLTDQENQKGRKYLIDNNKLNIGISISTNSPTRQWPYDRFLEVAKSLNKNNNVYILNKYKENYFDNKSNIINLTGVLSLREYCALISQLDLLITIDSSALHIAGHFDIDTVCLFGETLPKLRSTYYKNCRSILVPVVCRSKTGSCYLDSKSFYNTKNGCQIAEYQECMHLITTNQVLRCIHKNKAFLKDSPKIKGKVDDIKSKRILVKMTTGELGDKLVGLVLTSKIKHKYPDYEIDVYLSSERFNTLGGYDLLFEDYVNNCFLDIEMINNNNYDKIFEMSAYDIHKEELEESIRKYIPLSRYQRWAKRMDLGNFRGKVEPIYKVREEDGIRVNRETKFGELKQPIIGISPITSNVSKDWEQLEDLKSPKWQKVINYLHRKGCSVVSFHYKPLKYDNCLNLGNMNPRELGYVLSKLDLLIGTEAGTTHFAGILGIPMIVLVGSSSPVVLKHYDNVRIVRKGSCIDCSRFISPSFGNCKCGTHYHNPESKCITSVTSEEVIEEIKLFKGELLR